ncbi:CPXCG motif-containing cysteine-rich protein [Gloeobacter violaceus]|uniref:Gsl3476 protein n=1 Tax=Gloeobacter violaceus (strain ATCC 29082 / PCC 7421) TaxID=251221 RepID=Q7NFP8_GLOVI|nr:CPXCG motif-containing cysteine-rich protein [Gloeobacter violaceus]BAC91417.1 gsl3476 [Gloeobacter violaceus PCC 7421]
MEQTASYRCAYCGEENQTFVDSSAGWRQVYTEDCQVCCRPNVLTVKISRKTLRPSIEADVE